ncbi:MAG: cytochrome P450 [Acidimicrobiia bacterium]|nr:cytochrome P450 [Acidimicrobiia bacterium]
MARTETARPVASWTADYDIFEPGFVRDPYPIMDQMRRSPGIAHSERWGGSWLPTRYADVAAVAHDTDHFSSREVTVAPIPMSYDESGRALRSIIATDEPQHAPERRVILPFFSPKATQRYEPHTRELANRFIDDFIEQGRVDAAAQYARQIPPRIIAAILGVDPNRGDEFAEWVQGVLELGLQDPEIREKYRTIIAEFFLEEIARRQREPGDDLISWLLSQEIDGEPVPMNVVRGNVSLMLIAGIDTTWSSIGSALWHLASHPEDTARLVADPGLIPLAIEELLRAYSPVTMARIVSDEVELNGSTMHPGDRVLLSFPAANRDPDAFEDPDRVVIDRANNRHIAFGVGVHRCAGSNLARMEMRVALEEWLKRIPSFTLEDPAAVTWAGGQVRGPRSLPIRFPA